MAPMTGRLPACPDIGCKTGKLSVLVASAAEAIGAAVEGKEKNTARQLLQPGSCLEKGSLERPT